MKEQNIPNKVYIRILDGEDLCAEGYLQDESRDIEYIRSDIHADVVAERDELKLSYKERADACKKMADWVGRLTSERDQYKDMCGILANEIFQLRRFVRHMREANVDDRGFRWQAENKIKLAQKTLEQYDKVKGNE